MARPEPVYAGRGVCVEERQIAAGQVWSWKLRSYFLTFPACAVPDNWVVASAEDIDTIGQAQELSSTWCRHEAWPSDGESLYGYKVEDAC
jgi:hypothetical protein